MNQPLTNPTPKTRFQQSGDNITKHRALVDSIEFIRGTDFAMLQFQARLSVQGAGDGNGAMAMGFRLQGALEFLQELRLLAETPQKISTADVPALNHRV